MAEPMREMDDVSFAELQRESDRRRLCRELGRCDFCDKHSDEQVCKFPARHARARPRKEIVKVIPDDIANVCDQALAMMRMEHIPLKERLGVAGRALEAVIRRWD